jgi:hypothetical protein
MIEYPEISCSSKAPRKPCIAFEKNDGSNIRVKYTQKRGFDLFGSRTQLFDRSHPFLGEAIDIFKRDFDGPLTAMVKDNWPNEREVVVFLEFLGDQSFAGVHVPGDPKRLVLFDIMVGHKFRKFLLPQEFDKLAGNTLYQHLTAKIIYRGNLTDQFIKDVREGKYSVKEGVVCKGLERSGAYCGNIWMCKIKTNEYFRRIREKYGEEGVKKYGE